MAPVPTGGNTRASSVDRKQALKDRAKDAKGAKQEAGLLGMTGSETESGPDSATRRELPKVFSGSSGPVP
jgi:hypothetical protein